MSPGLVGELAWRGQIKDCTDAAPGHPALASFFNDAGSPRRVYAGFDPTADSLTIGNLVTIMALAHVLRAGHEPVVLLGGGTGLIGDPSGKSAERQLQTPEVVRQNIDKIRPIFDSVFSAARSSPIGARATQSVHFVNNADWLGGLGYIQVLRDVGKHFSVNQMIQKDSVRERLTNRDQGISYTEFSYQILQAYDFLHLSRELDVRVQFGGSDQFGNITAGVELIRRVAAGESASRREAENTVADHFGLTWPLITKADGTKFGKTESGAVWLTAERTSAYAYHQFWLNAADDDVERFLKTFTFIGRAEIDALMEAHRANPGAREAQRRLADAATAILHGRDAATRAEAAGRALFSGDLGGLDEPTLRDVFAGLPTSDRPRGLLAGDGVALIDILVDTGVAKSKREAREFLESGSIAVNGVRVEPAGAAPDTVRLTIAHLMHGSLTAIRRGKKQWHLVRWA